MICVTYILRLVTPQATILDEFLDEIAYFEGLWVNIVPAANHPTPPFLRYESPDLGHLYEETLIRGVGEKGWFATLKLSHFELGVLYVLSSSQKWRTPNTGINVTALIESRGICFRMKFTFYNKFFFFFFFLFLGSWKSSSILARCFLQPAEVSVHH